MTNSSPEISVDNNFTNIISSQSDVWAPWKALISTLAFNILCDEVNILNSLISLGFFISTVSTVGGPYTLNPAASRF